MECKLSAIVVSEGVRTFGQFGDEIDLKPHTEKRILVNQVGRRLSSGYSG